MPLPPRSPPLQRPSAGPLAARGQRARRSAAALVLLGASALGWPARGSTDEDAPADAEIVVEGAGQRRGATARRLGRAAVEASPGRSADDLLRAMPGLHQSAHGGQGKAYQYYLRGFDAVHGADLAVTVEDVPVNEPSNVHAHGYLDLHFIPTALVSGLELRPGPYDPEVGDFAIAGSAAYALGLTQPGGVVALGGGTDRSAAAALSYRPSTGTSGDFAVADVELGHGVGMARGFRQARAGAGLEGQLGGAQARAWLLAYDGVFESPGVLREDDLADGTVGFYDAYPGSGGGRSTRLLGAATLLGGDGRWAGRMTTWGGLRALALEQNFTGYLVEPVLGDGTVQEYTAAELGLAARAHYLGWRAVRPGAGLQLRLDRLSQREAAIDPTGAVWAERARLGAGQGAIGGWLSAPSAVAPWLALEPALRAELFLIDVDGVNLSWASALAPKVSARLFPAGRATGFFNYGRGFRSPDARGAGQGGPAPLSLADTVELGLQASLTDALGLRAAAYTTQVSDELVFDPVAARYLATGQTRRLGLDAGLSTRPSPALRLDADLSLCRAVYAATGLPLPYAPRLLLVTGLFAEGRAIGQAALTGGLRLVVLGPRPLPSGFLSHTALSADLTATVRRGPWGASLDVANLLGNRWRDGEFVFPSQWEAGAAPTDLLARHFTAGTPTSARLSLSRSF